MITVYGIKNCDSVKKARRWLDAHGIEYRFVDFKNEPVDCTVIDRWLERADIKTLFNSRSTTCRTLGLKAMNLDDTQKRAWLCKENLLVKRPVIENENRVIIGFNESTYEGAFLS